MHDPVKDRSEFILEAWSAISLSFFRHFIRKSATSTAHSDATVVGERRVCIEIMLHDDFLRKQSLLKLKVSPETVLRINLNNCMIRSNRLMESGS
jgi:hypothetical protein